MKKIYLVRHGESFANFEEKVYGKDVSLTPHGQIQAEKVAQRVSHLDIDQLIVSDYVRAQETMAPIAREKQLSPIVHAAFGEIAEPSEYFGTDVSGPQIVAWRNARNAALNDESFDAGDGESFWQVHQRAVEAKSFLENLESDTALVVSHALFLRYFIATLVLDTSEPHEHAIAMMKRMRTANTSVSLITYEEDFGWRLIMLNDHAHFAE